jgi:hypothetical protein
LLLITGQALWGSWRIKNLFCVSKICKISITLFLWPCLPVSHLISVPLGQDESLLKHTIIKNRQTTKTATLTAGIKPTGNLGYSKVNGVTTQGHSVQISDTNVDNMMTLCCLRRPSGRSLDYI